MAVHLRELHAGIRPNHCVNGQAALDHQQQETGGILAPAQTDRVKILFGGNKSAHLGHVLLADLLLFLQLVDRLLTLEAGAAQLVQGI